MPSFAVWLHNQEGGPDSDLRALQNFAAATPRWPYWSDTLTDYKSAITQTAPPPANREVLIETLIEHFGQWRAEERLGRPRLTFRQMVGHAIAENPGIVALVLFGLVVAAVIIFGLQNTGFYLSLAKTDQARGLITFLFAFSTTGVIILIAIAIFWMEREDLKDRFANAKDLLTIVIGVLGTIMGFYFGSQALESGSLSIANVTLSAPVAKPNDKITLSGQIIGGKGPYQVSVEFSDPTGNVPTAKMNVTDGKTEAGLISQTIQIPAEAKQAGVIFKVTAKDSKGTNAQFTGTLFIQP